MFPEYRKFVDGATYSCRGATLKFSVLLSLFTSSFVAILMGVGFCNQAGAVEDTEALTLLQAYGLAQQHDAQIAAARAQLDVGREQLPQGRAGLLPSIVLDGDYSRSNQETSYNTLTSSLVTIEQNQVFTSSGVGINLVQPLFRMQNLAAYRQAKALVGVAEQTFELAEQTLILRVAQVYFDMLRAEGTLAAAKAQTEAAFNSLSEARRKFEVGTLTVTDVHEAQARHDLSRAEEIAAVNDLELGKQAVRKIIGKMPTRLAAANKDLPLSPLEPQDMSLWVKTAMANSPTIRIAIEELEVTQQQLARNRGERYPNVDLVASYRDDVDRGDDLVGDGRDTTTEFIGIQFQMSLYRGGELKSKIREATANVLQSKENLREAKEQVALDTRQAYLTVASGRLQVQALRQALVSSESSLKTTQRGFEVGIRTSLDVLNSQQQFFSAQRDLINAKYNYLNSLLTLQAAIGVLSIIDLEDINRLLN